MIIPSTFSSLDPQRQAVASALLAERTRAQRSACEEGLSALSAELQRRALLERLRASVPSAFTCFQRPARYKGAHGGRGSAKSWSFGTHAVLRLKEQPRTRIVCIREVQRSLEQSVKRLLEDLIQLYELGSDFRILNTHIETPAGGLIIFQGMQNHTAESIKSLEGYDVAWVEEAQSLSDRSLTLLRPTLRKEHSELWFTWNPEHKTDPIDVLLRGPVPLPDSIVREVSYRDNPYMPDVLRREMEWDMLRDPDKYAHVWLGGYVRASTARVFRNWRVEDFRTPFNVPFLFGGDWGYANDPAVLVRGFIDTPARTLYIDSEAYAVGCEIDDTPALFDSVGCNDCRPGAYCDGGGVGHGMARQWLIVSDSNRPETISYMRRNGYGRIVGAKKGQGSVKEGVKFLQSYDIVVHPRCVHTIDELTMYSYKTHPLTGTIIPVLLDKKNHVIDSLRYMVEGVKRTIDATWTELMQNVPTPEYLAPMHPARLRAEAEDERSDVPTFTVPHLNSLFGR